MDREYVGMRNDRDQDSELEPVHMMDRRMDCDGSEGQETIESRERERERKFERKRNKKSFALS